MSMDMYKMMIESPEKNNELVLDLAREIFGRWITKDKLNLEIMHWSLRKFTVDISNKDNIVNINIEFEKDLGQDEPAYARLTIDMNKWSIFSKGEVLNSDTNIFGIDFAVYLGFILKEIEKITNASYGISKLKISTDTSQQLLDFKRW